MDSTNIGAASLWMRRSKSLRSVMSTDKRHFNDDEGPSGIASSKNSCTGHELTFGGCRLLLNPQG
jgi:hypothetical protein